MNMNNDKQFPLCPVSTSSKKDEYKDNSTIEELKTLKEKNK